MVQARPLGDGLALEAAVGNEIRLIALDPVGAASWLCLADSLQPDQIVDELAAAFPTQPRERIEADVWDMLVVWAQMGLLDESVRTDAKRRRGPASSVLEAEHEVRASSVIT
jgi:hypothetical protein